MNIISTFSLEAFGKQSNPGRQQWGPENASVSCSWTLGQGTQWILRVQ